MWGKRYKTREKGIEECSMRFSEAPMRMYLIYIRGQQQWDEATPAVLSAVAATSSGSGQNIVWQLYRGCVCKENRPVVSRSEVLDAPKAHGKAQIRRKEQWAKRQVRGVGLNRVWGVTTGPLIAVLGSQTQGARCLWLLLYDAVSRTNRILLNNEMPLFFFFSYKCT